jgi:hypothetical protein
MTNKPTGNLTERVKMAANGDTLTKTEKDLLQSLLTKIAAKFGLPAILLSIVGAVGGSWIGTGNAATKDDVQKLEAIVKAGFSTAGEERTALRLRIDSLERSEIENRLERKALEKAFDEYKRTHP